MDNDFTLCDFSDLKEWTVVNDGVMGGLSEGKLTKENDKAVFSGKVSLENNGGFTSIRRSVTTDYTKPISQFKIKLKGDGKRYQFRVRKSGEYFTYTYDFKTSGKYETIVINAAEMQPTFRGQILNYPNFDGDDINEIGFLIANKKMETFAMLLDEVAAK